jgi:hypothetical protein
MLVHAVQITSKVVVGLVLQHLEYEGYNGTKKVYPSAELAASIAIQYHSVSVSGVLAARYTCMDSALACCTGS